jgi:hypothetical protein
MDSSQGYEWPDWGHEDQFRPPSLSGGSRFGEATFAGMSGKEEGAPQTDLRSMILRMKYWQPVAVRTLVAERHSYARWRPGHVLR